VGGISLLIESICLMAEITFPYKSDFFTDSDKSIQLVFRILGTFIILFIFIAPISIVEANIFEVTIQELGSKSRSTIKIAVIMVILQYYLRYWLLKINVWQLQKMKD
jgi:hypothetical protein